MPLNYEVLKSGWWQQEISKNCVHARFPLIFLNGSLDSDSFLTCLYWSVLKGDCRPPRSLSPHHFLLQYSSLQNLATLGILRFLVPLLLRESTGLCMGSPSLSCGPEILLRQYIWNNHMAFLVGFLFLWHCCPSLPDVQCLENHCNVYSCLFCFVSCYFRLEVKSGPSWLEVEAIPLLF